MVLHRMMVLERMEEILFSAHSLHMVVEVLVEMVVLHKVEMEQ